MKRHIFKRPKAHASPAREAKAALALRLDAQQDEHIADIAKVLNQCLGMLDLLGLSQAAIHLSAAIDAMPGQAALPPIDMVDLMAG